MAQSRFQFTPRRRVFYGVLVALWVLFIWIGNASPIRAALAVAVVGILLKIGFMILGSLASPLPGPPPPGELRRVKIAYRCSICGTEVRMTVANDEMPDPPRHCQDEMDLVAPIED